MALGKIARQRQGLVIYKPQQLPRSIRVECSLMDVTGDRRGWFFGYVGLIRPFDEGPGGAWGWSAQDLVQAEVGQAGEQFFSKKKRAHLGIVRLFLRIRRLNRAP